MKIGIADAAQALDVVRDFENRLGPGPILVQRQAAPGLELVIGATRDPNFGPAIVFGLGGIWIEALDDVAVRIAPFTEQDAASMFDELRGRAVLDGARGRPGVDRAALARLLATLVADGSHGHHGLPNSISIRSSPTDRTSRPWTRALRIVTRPANTESER